MYVCFNCQNSRRNNVSVKSVPVCQFCKNKMKFAFYKFEMPAKDDRKGWTEFKKLVMDYNKDISSKMIGNYRKDIELLEKKISNANENNQSYIIKLKISINEKLNSIKFYQEHFYRI